MLRLGVHTRAPPPPHACFLTAPWPGLGETSRKASAQGRKEVWVGVGGTASGSSTTPAPLPHLISRFLVVLPPRPIAMATVFSVALHLFLLPISPSASPQPLSSSVRLHSCGLLCSVLAPHPVSSPPRAPGSFPPAQSVETPQETELRAKEQADAQRQGLPSRW